MKELQQLRILKNILKMIIINKKVRGFIYVLITLLFFGCSDSKNDDGVKILFYENGNIKKIAQYNKEGLLDGYNFCFSEDAKLYEYEKYENSTLVERRVYNENGSSQLDRYKFDKKEDCPILNEKIYFDAFSGIIKDKSRFISLKSIEDTIKNGEMFKIEISLEASYFNHAFAVFIGEMDDYYKFVNEDSIEVCGPKTYPEEFKVTYETESYNLGNNVIEGYVYDAHITINDSTGVTSEKIAPVFFKTSFFVVDK